MAMNGRRIWLGALVGVGSILAASAAGWVYRDAPPASSP